MNGCDCACHHGYGNAHNEQTCRCKGGEGYRSIEIAQMLDTSVPIPARNPPGRRRRGRR